MPSKKFSMSTSMTQPPAVAVALSTTYPRSGGHSPRPESVPILQKNPAQRFAPALSALPARTPFPAASEHRSGTSSSPCQASGWAPDAPPLSGFLDESWYHWGAGRFVPAPPHGLSTVERSRPPGARATRADISTPFNPGGPLELTMARPKMPPYGKLTTACHPHLFHLRG